MGKAVRSGPFRTAAGTAVRSQKNLKNLLFSKNVVIG